MTNPLENEHSPQEPRKGIASLLPRYYQEFEDNIIYEPLVSYKMGEHEVAWMRFRGVVEHDITGQDKEGEAFEGRSLCCECDFREGVGWKVEDGRSFNLDAPRDCVAKEAVVRMRHLELRQYYSNFYSESDKPNISQHTDEIILDLIERGKQGEFLEQGSGAKFWGGYFYLQTVAAITGQEMKEVVPIVQKMIASNKILLEGMVVQEYSPAPEPSWQEFLTIQQDGFVARASLPVHGRMDQDWRIELIAPNGEPMVVSRSNLHLTHLPTFGPDADDVESVRQELERLLKTFQEKI